MAKEKYLEIVGHYENCLEKHGDSHLGVDWPREKDVETRYRVMHELFRKDASKRIVLLDFGCGLSHFYEYLNQQKQKNVKYIGLDLSKKFVELSRKKFPRNEYVCMDILKRGANALPGYDYAVANGVYTQKRSLSQSEMTQYLKRQTKVLFGKARKGIAFNVMSPEVDWKRPGAFHLDFKTLTHFLSKEVSRNFVLRHDYGLYEYTVYIYK